jgi:hypothetical protein
MTKPVTQPEVNTGCRAARDKYAAMTPRTAALTFAFEMQGFVAAQVETHGADFRKTLDSVAELLLMLERANRHV